eukprot:1178455-Alexandrium_andersonii.AAC.1
MVAASDLATRRRAPAATGPARGTLDRRVAGPLAHSWGSWSVGSTGLRPRRPGGGPPGSPRAKR